MFEIYPLKGANQIEFGMTPEQVRQHMGPNFQLFKRGGNVEDDDGDHPSDYYTEEGVFFYYSSEGYLEAIEFAPSAPLKVAGVNFFEMSMNLAVEALRRMDADIKINGCTAHSDDLGISLWTSNGYYDAERQTWDEEDEEDEDWEPEEAKVGSVLIARPGYLAYLNED